VKCGVTLAEFHVIDLAAIGIQSQLREVEKRKLPQPDGAAVLKLYFREAVFPGGKLEAFLEGSVDRRFSPRLHIRALHGHVALDETQTDDASMRVTLRPNRRYRKQRDKPCYQYSD
jgi:hypothetical protein